MKISVYITSYNKKHYLQEAIESALAQTLRPYQIIIIDDFSSDGSQAVIERYYSQYSDLIVPIYHRQNNGVAYCRSEALQQVTGDLVTGLDGDDRFLPTKLEKEVAALDGDPQAQLAFSNVCYIDEHGTRIGQWAEDSKPPAGNIFCQTFGRDFPKRNLFRSELVYYQAWKRIGFHDLNLRNLYEDYDMRIRLTKKMRAVYCDEPLSEYRLHKEGLSRVSLVRHVEALDYIYHKNKHLLDDVSPSERDYVRQQFGEWTGSLARRAAEESLQANRHWQAVRLLLAARRYDPSQFSSQLLAQIFVSRAAACR